MGLSAEEPGKGPAWALEWLPLASVVQHSPWQVRRGLDAAAVRRYAAMTQAGSRPPPIKVARLPCGGLYLVDGWHRMEAGAINTATDSFDGAGAVKVEAEVASLSEAQARWEAAASNMAHGVPLKTRELRAVFRAFIAAKRHHKGRGQFMSYREMGAALGVNHTTIRNWAAKDAPALFAALGGATGGTGGLAEGYAQNLQQEHAEEARRALLRLRQALPGLSPEDRAAVLADLEAATAEARSLGPPPGRPEF